MPPTTSSAAVTTREAVFAAEDDARYFLGLLARYRQRFGFRLFHYALLTNHFHLLIQVDKPRRLSSLMAGLLLAYVRYFNRKYGFVGQGTTLLKER
jgi:REP element-mobilizing transposase RayT